MKTADRCLLHTIHANTLSVGRSRKGAGWGGTIVALALTGVLVAASLWMEAHI